MDCRDTPEDQHYRATVRAAIASVSAELEHADGDYLAEPGAFDFEAARRSQQALFDLGLVGLTLPTEYGGSDGTFRQQSIVNEELARARVAGLPNHVGIGMCAPTVLVHGTKDQKTSYIRRLLRGDDIWCQLFSEPGGGSDLAALRTTARLQDDGTWRISGQKVWNTHAQHAVFGILLARSEAGSSRHRGLTMFILDMTTPGVTVRPIRQMNGQEEFTEVFLDDVVIGDSFRLGGAGAGWAVALTTLMNERVAVGGGGGELGVRLPALVDHASRRIPRLPADDQALARQELGAIVTDSLASRFSGLKYLTEMSAGKLPGPEASAGKLVATRTARAGADLGVRLLGPEALFARTDEDEWVWPMAQASVVGMSFAGGTDEILRNIIGERVLGLAAEPRPSSTKAGV